MKIKFVKGHKPKGHSADIPEYREGEVYDFTGQVSEGYAEKYIRLGYAVAHVAVKPVVVEPVESVAETVSGGIKVDAVKDFRRRK